MAKKLKVVRNFSLISSKLFNNFCKLVKVHKISFNFLNLFSSFQSSRKSLAFSRDNTQKIYSKIFPFINIKCTLSSGINFSAKTFMFVDCFFIMRFTAHWLSSELWKEKFTSKELHNWLEKFIKLLRSLTFNSFEFFISMNMGDAGKK